MATTEARQVRRDEIAANLTRLQERIDRALVAADRAGEQVQLLPVTKFHPAGDLRILLDLGFSEVAENREQEARAKAAEVPQARIHMIGQIQSKKANSVARWASQVHSVDSARLIAGLDRGMGLALERGDRETPDLPCFIQLSADGDTSRGGVVAAEIGELAEQIEAAEHLSLAGLMCVPPIDADPAEVFSLARKLTDQLGERLGRRLKLSGGMSGDLEAAIAAGTDVVRVGTAILGARQVP